MDEDFKRFLELLCPAADDAAVYHCYRRLWERLEGFFNMRGVRDTTGAAVATVERAVRRIAEGAPVPDAGRYCMGIARNVANEKLRSERRESKAFLKFIEELDDDSGEEVARIYQVLRPCFELLAAEDRELLAAYCGVMRGRARAEHRRGLAASREMTVEALRVQVMRLRKELADCVEKGSKDA